MSERDNPAPGKGQTDGDPFAELVRLVEEPVYGHGRSLRPNPKRWEDEIASGGEVSSAFLALSEPASPRDANPAETQSFAPVPPRHYEEPRLQQPYLDDFDALIASEMAAMKQVETRYETSRGDDPHEAGMAAGSEEHQSRAEAWEAQDDAAFADVMRQRPKRGRVRQGVAFVSGVAGMALVSIVGALVWNGLSGGGAGGNEPLLIKAEAEPYKMVPENPGGRQIPNQNKAVYQRMATGGPSQAPEQQMLIGAAEEPLDISIEDDPIEDLPGVGMIAEPVMTPVEGFETAQADVGTGARVAPPEPALQPRRVRTYEVRPDGTLIMNNETSTGEAAPADQNPPAATPQQAEPAPRPVEPVAPPAAFAVPAGRPAPVTEIPAVAAPVTPPAAAGPVQQPTVAAEAPPAGSYFVQISSQPSEALARESMNALGRRYSGIIGSRNVSIQSAVIPDRGTFYRVRVAAQTRDEANSVCAELKSAGGSCLVTR